MNQPTPLLAAVAAVALVALAGCTSTPASAPSGSAPESASASTAASPSGSRQAWQRGTKVTLTNSTGSAQLLSAGDSDYATLADGASTSQLDPWNSTSETGVSWRWELDDTTVFMISFFNGLIGTPHIEACTIATPSDTACSEAFGMLKIEHFSEGETKTITLTREQQVVASFTATRNADDDDNKNWTATLDSVTDKGALATAS